MAGTLPNIALVQQRDLNDEVMAGCELRIYAAGTLTPVTAYKDVSLTAGQEQPWPIPADDTGRVPLFYLADGNYRARLSSADGSYVAFDVPILATVGSSSGSGGSSTVNISAWDTGKFDWQPVSGTRADWVRANGRSVGSASSGATERANADCQALYEFLYGAFPDTICPVSGGRGATAAADWAANKPIATPDMRFIFGGLGLDDMGNTAAGRATNVPTAIGNATIAGSRLGEALHTLSQGELPAIKPAITINDPGHTHTVSNLVGSGSTISTATGGAQGVNGETGSSTTGITAAFTANLGSGTAHNNTPLAMPGTWYIKL